MLLFNMHSLCLLLLLSTCVLTLKMCVENKKYINYYKIRSCFKSSLPIISTKNFNNLPDCIKFAREKNALAFNFSPPEMNRVRNCEVIGCPEIHNSTSFVFDPNYDYYSAYGDFNCELMFEEIIYFRLYKLCNKV